MLQEIHLSRYRIDIVKVLLHILPFSSCDWGNTTMYADIARSALTQLAQVAMSARMSLSNLWISVPGSLAGFMWFLPKQSLPCSREAMASQCKLPQACHLHVPRHMPPTYSVSKQFGFMIHFLQICQTFSAQSRPSRKSCRTQPAYAILADHKLLARCRNLLSHVIRETGRGER